MPPPFPLYKGPLAAVGWGGAARENRTKSSSGPGRDLTPVPRSRRLANSHWLPWTVATAMLLALSACGGGYDEYTISDVWGNEETVRVPIGDSPSQVSSFAYLAELVEGDGITPGQRSCLQTHYNGRMMTGSVELPSVAAREALEICGFAAVAGG